MTLTINRQRLLALVAAIVLIFAGYVATASQAKAAVLTYNSCAETGGQIKVIVNTAPGYLGCRQQGYANWVNSAYGSPFCVQHRSGKVCFRGSVGGKGYYVANLGAVTAWTTR